MSVWVIALTAFGVTVASQLVSRFITNQSKIKHLRDEVKTLSAKLKKLDPTSEEHKKIQDRILEINSELMRENFRSWPATMAIFMLAFFLLSSLYAYNPITVGSNVSLEATGYGVINSSCLNLSQTVEGKYSGKATVLSDNCTIELDGEEFQLEFKNKPQEFKTEGLELKVTPEKRIFINLPFSLPIVGNKIGWLGTYILCSLIASTLVTRLFDKFRVGRW